VIGDGRAEHERGDTSGLLVFSGAAAAIGVWILGVAEADGEIPIDGGLPISESRLDTTASLGVVEFVIDILVVLEGFFVFGCDLILAGPWGGGRTSIGSGGCASAGGGTGVFLGTFVWRGRSVRLFLGFGFLLRLRWLA